MNILVHLTDIASECTDVQQLSMVVDEVNKGNHVFILNCDSTIGMCVRNPHKNKAYCSVCKNMRKFHTHKLAPKGVEVHQMSEFTKSIDRKALPKLHYDNAEQLRSLTYKGVDIGFGVLSTYISNTRNLNPKIDSKSRLYFDSLIEVQQVTIEVLEMLQQKYNFQLVIFSNGRGVQTKPFLNFCERKQIEYWCVENLHRSSGVNYIDNFHNSIPHNITTQCKRAIACWESAPETSAEKETIARNFYENRRNAKPAGDTVYIANQQAGKMPEDWNTSVENIVIFNSSEDEFCAVSHEFDKEAVFKSQIEGIIEIVEHYRNDSNKMFTLRVHPNLKDIQYKYHTDLYKLQYPNLRVIPGSSSVSTYSLIDAADKVIVFGSTTGIESVYWGKPVICLAGAYYRDFDVVYKPNNIDELWMLIDQDHLKCKYNEKVLAYGYYIMSNNHEKCKNFNIDFYHRKFLGFHIYGFKEAKILGSNFLYALIVKLLETITKRAKAFDYFKELPLEEA